MSGKQWQPNAGVNLETLLAGNQPVIRVGQIAVRREAHDVPRASNRLQPRVPGQRKASPQHILRQSVDRQRHKLMGVVAQQRRGIASQHLP